MHYSCIVQSFFFFNIKLSTVHVYQMTSCSSITEHRAINFDWVAVSPSLSRDQKLIEFFSSRQNGHLEEKFGHAHTFLNIPDKISLLIYWVTSSHNLYSLMREGGGRKKEGGGWLRTLSFCQEFSHSALLVIGGNKPSIKRVNLLFYLICVVVQSATIDWKNAGNQWIFITVTCHHRLRGIRCACI